MTGPDAAGAQQEAEARYVAARLAEDYVGCVKQLLGMTVWLPVQGQRHDLLVAHRGDQGLVYAYTSPARVTAVAAPDVHPENSVRRRFADLVSTWRHPEIGLVINPGTESEFQIPRRLFDRVLQIQRELRGGMPARISRPAPPPPPATEPAQDRGPAAPGPAPAPRAVPIEPPDEIDGFRFAAMVDALDEDGTPRVSDERGSVEGDAEKRRIRQYLAGGAVLQLVTGAVVDMFEPSRGAVVPASTRTDGEWIWSDGVGYYLDEYDVAPEPDFYRAVVAAGYTCPEVGPDRVAAAGRALAERQRIAAELHQQWRREHGRGSDRV